MYFQETLIIKWSQFSKFLNVADNIYALYTNKFIWGRDSTHRQLDFIFQKYTYAFISNQFNQDHSYLALTIFNR